MASKNIFVSVIRFYPQKDLFIIVNNNWTINKVTHTCRGPSDFIPNSHFMWKELSRLPLFYTNYIKTGWYSVLDKCSNLHCKNFETLELPWCSMI